VCLCTSYSHVTESTPIIYIIYIYIFPIARLSKQPTESQSYISSLSGITYLFTPLSSFGNFPSFLFGHSLSALFLSGCVRSSSLFYRSLHHSFLFFSLSLLFPDSLSRKSNVTLDPMHNYGQNNHAMGMFNARNGMYRTCLCLCECVCLCVSVRMPTPSQDLGRTEFVSFVLWRRTAVRQSHVHTRDGTDGVFYIMRKHAL